MPSDLHSGALLRVTPEGAAKVVVDVYGLPGGTVAGLQRERDHLLLLHEALAEVERAPTMSERLRIFVQAIRRVGFGRVMLTLRDAQLDATRIVCAGLSPDEERFVNEVPTPGHVWKRRLAEIDRFRISNSYYLDGNDPWVIAEFGSGEVAEDSSLLGTLPAAQADDWSPRDTLLVPLRDGAGRVTATLSLDQPDDRARPTLTRVRTVELFAQQVAAILAQAEHRALAERHRRVVETSSDAIVITDRNYRIAFANPAAIAMFGRGPDLIGQPASITVAADMVQLVRDHEDRALAGEPQRYEAAVVRPDGDRRLLSITTAPLRELGEVTGIVASLRDVTEERRALDAVAQSEALYRNLFDSATDAIYTLDQTGLFTSANHATCTLAGEDRESLLGTSCRTLVHPDDLGLVAASFDRAMAGESAQYECRLVRRDGDTRLLSETYTPIQDERGVVGVLAVARDVTLERERASALARSEAQYARLVESAPDGIFTLDIEGNFTAVNHSLERTIGGARAALLGRPLALLVDPRDAAAVSQLLRETFAGERGRGQLRYRSAAGELRHGSVITSPIFEGDRIAGALGIMRDMTDEVRLAEQLLHQEKLAAVGQLVSGVAHELNNPLAGVMAFSQLLLASRASRDAEARSAVETIHREAQRAAKIVSNLLTFARQQPAERAETDLNRLVVDTLELRRFSLRSANIDVVTQLDESLPHTWADPFQLQQVLLNLIGNAEHALTDWSGARLVTIRTRRDGEQLVLSVSDTGPGIPLERRDRIFNPFFTTKPVGQGTGLGLSISDGIAREHAGRLRVESQEGEGATFVLELPFVAIPDEPVLDVSQPASSPLAGRRVLVVDDEPAMRSAMSAFLGSLGHDVVISASGADARRLLADGVYDAILLDLRLSDVGGDVLYRELFARDPGQAARVVFVTGDTQSDVARRFLAESGRPSLGKPFQLDDLATVIAALTR
ncbi:MAG: PAS domain S-box protein [bacterium]